jgi:hypothetical protein
LRMARLPFLKTDQQPVPGLAGFVGPDFPTASIALYDPVAGTDAGNPALDFHGESNPSSKP